MGENQTKKLNPVSKARPGKIFTPFVSDIILVSIGFYVGDDKGNGFHLLPFLLLGAIAAGTMILSEVEHFCLRRILSKLLNHQTQSVHRYYFSNFRVTFV